MRFFQYFEFLKVTDMFRGNVLDFFGWVVIGNVEQQFLIIQFIKGLMTQFDPAYLIAGNAAQ